MTQPLATPSPAATDWVPMWSLGPVQPKITTSPIAGGPPAAPNDGDIWNATAVGTRGIRWQFQYDAAESSAYKWKFIGGPHDFSSNGMNTFQNTADGVWENNSGVKVSVARPGYYSVRFGAETEISGTSVTAYLAVGPATNSAWVPYNYMTSNISITLWTTLVAEMDMLTNGQPAFGGPATIYLLNDSSNRGAIAFQSGWLSVVPVKVS